MRRHKGFSLLEILVAFAIMAVALTILLRIFGSGVNNAQVAEEYSLAVQIAESLMARTGIETPLEAGVISGSEADKYDWQVTVAAVAQAAPPDPQGNNNQAQNNANPGMTLFSVKVRVVWGEDGAKQRLVELNSLKTL